MKYHFKTQMIKLEELFTSEMSCVVYLQHGGCTLIYCYLSQQLRAGYSGLSGCSLVGILSPQAPALALPLKVALTKFLSVYL